MELLHIRWIQKDRSTCSYFPYLYGRTPCRIHWSPSAVQLSHWQDDGSRQNHFGTEVGWHRTCAGCCGSGLLALSMAKHVTHVSCIDLWNEERLGASRRQLFVNAQLEGVAQNRLEVVTGDARRLPQVWNASFDVVVSSLTLHNIARGDFSVMAQQKRVAVLKEILRVLKPGGQLAIWDMCPNVFEGCVVQEYPKALRHFNEVTNVVISEAINVFWPSYIVSARKV
eukprot:gnl/MRDRNA2_/MRDRNA2_79338_c0_seq1.p1 gnl/MRDRNA2_/MRDRNA2_79338_c0~~gnl/MRDRNA2_/MRDRNA2_79338_c0_seq1.p1  ORF type:complete len:226 (+),score=29.97 gnl/MRDRNA2_/MRDRNA2_79338_c0_seq1:315-992(+)